MTTSAKVERHVAVTDDIHLFNDKLREGRTTRITIGPTARSAARRRMSDSWEKPAEVLGPYTRKLVGAAGFEPAAPSAQVPHYALPCVSRRRRRLQVVERTLFLPIKDVRNVGVTLPGKQGDASAARGTAADQTASPTYAWQAASFAASPYKLERLGPCRGLPTPSERPQDRIEHGVQFPAHIRGKKAQHEVAVLL